MRTTILASGLLILLSLAACTSPRQPQSDVEKLSRALPILQQMQVKNFRNQDWCKTIVYPQGKFSSSPESNTCNLFSGSPQPFTEQANQDFAQIASAVRQTQVPLYAISIKYSSNKYNSNNSPNQTIRRAEFLLTSGGGYVYEPNYTQLPPDLPNELEYKPVNQDWYAFWQDWN